MKRRALALLAALSLVSAAPAQVTFAFNYLDAGVGFNDSTFGASRRGALESAASTLASYFNVGSARTVTFDVESHVTNSGTLASAGSPVSYSGNGFWRTVAQDRIISGAYSNTTVLGEINWNFFHDWDYDNDVGGSSFDFKSVAMHEILHGLGFFSFVSSTERGATNQISGSGDVWSIFDQFLTNSSGTNLVVGDAFNTALTGIVSNTGGAASDVFFEGANAVAVYGGLVPIYSPATFESGSSLSHLNTTIFGTNNFIMTHAVTTGPSVRSLSTLELAILTDLGYSVTAIPEPSTYAVIFGSLALVVVYRRRRAA